MTLKHRIRALFRRAGFDINRVGNVDVLASLIYGKYHPGFFFIQIGANDGRRFDPIHEVVVALGLAGLALEPVKEYFDELQRTYRNTAVVAVNKALYYESRPITINRVVRHEGMAEWAKGIASLDPEYHKKSGIGPELMAQETVEAITFEQLLDEHKVRNVDLLQIDTEGFDAEIIKMIPFDRIRPQIIHFEHGLPHNVMTKAQFLEVISLLIGRDYKIIMKDYDCIAYQ